MTRAEPSHLAAIVAQTRRETRAGHMLSGHIEGRLLNLLVRLAQPKLVIELGTLTGYATLCMAEALIDGARILTCEHDSHAARIARAHFDASPWRDRIELRVGEARETLLELDAAIDFAYVDADKRAYPEYYEMLLERMSPGAVMVFDNMWMKGTVLDPDDQRGATLHALNRHIMLDSRVENVFLALGDGVHVVRKV